LGDTGADGKEVGGVGAGGDGDGVGDGAAEGAGSVEEKEEICGAGDIVERIPTVECWWILILGNGSGPGVEVWNLMAWTGGLSSLSLRKTGDRVPVLTLVFLLMTALLPFLMTTLSSCCGLSCPSSFLLTFPLLPCLLLRSLLL